MADSPEYNDYLHAFLRGLNPCGEKENPDTRCTYFKQCNSLDEQTNGNFLCVPRLTYELTHRLNNGEDVQRTGVWLLRSLQAYIGKKAILPMEPTYVIRTLDEGRLKELFRDISARALVELGVGRDEAYDIWKEASIERTLTNAEMN
jgi:hypothetical protein